MEDNTMRRNKSLSTKKGVSLWRQLLVCYLLPSTAMISIYHGFVGAVCEEEWNAANFHWKCLRGVLGKEQFNEILLLKTRSIVVSAENVGISWYNISDHLDKFDLTKYAWIRSRFRSPCSDAYICIYMHLCLCLMWVVIVQGLEMLKARCVNVVHIPKRFPHYHLHTSKRPPAFLSAYVTACTGAHCLL